MYEYSKYYPDDFNLDFESVQTQSIAKLLAKVVFLNSFKLYNFGKI